MEKETSNVLEEASQFGVGKNFFRRFALKLLDTENGLPKEIYADLTVMLVKSDNDDILENVDLTPNGLAYLGEDYVEEELSKVEDKLNEMDE